MQGALYDSTDYGSDFTSDEEEILSELLARVDRSGTAAVEPQQRTQATVSISDSVAVRDIEDYSNRDNSGHEAAPRRVSSSQPKVLGREKRSIFSWMRRTEAMASNAASSQMANYNDILGMFPSLVLFF